MPAGGQPQLGQPVVHEEAAAGGGVHQHEVRHQVLGGRRRLRGAPDRGAALNPGQGIGAVVSLPCVPGLDRPQRGVDSLPCVSLVDLRRLPINPARRAAATRHRRRARGHRRAPPPRPRPRVVVDLGAGTGTFAVSVAPYCRQVVAVDVSGPMTAALRARVEDLGLDNVGVVEGGFLSWMPGAVSDPAVCWTAEELAEHVRGEFSTYSWLLDPMLDRTGFDIVERSFRRSAYGTSTCKRRGS
ncbi:MAG: methyltransferase domain-containing protein [Acidimicrobiales bacterium]